MSGEDGDRLGRTAGAVATAIGYTLAGILAVAAIAAGVGAVALIVALSVRAVRAVIG